MTAIEVSNPPIRLVDTNFNLARQVGAILDATRNGSERIVDAHMCSASPAV